MIGNRNRRVEIWRPTNSVDAANEPLPTSWEFYRRKWASVRGESGVASIRSAASAGGVNTPLDRYSFRIAYDPTITIDMRLRECTGEHHNIIAVRHDKAYREWTDIVTELGGANG